MKKFIFISILNMIACFDYAQLKTEDVFKQTEVVWYGLDFSKAKFVGRVEQAKGIHEVNSFDLIHKYIPAWNELVVLEPANFNLQSAFRKSIVYYDLKPVTERNAKIQDEGLITFNSNMIYKDDLEKIVSSYTNGDKKEGLGLVFVMESFNKPCINGSCWVVFFDIKTKKILLSEYCQGKPAGFGLRNYWAGSIKQIIAGIRFSKYDQWRKQYSKRSEASSATAKK